jgi:hypothetical protein
MRWWNGIAWTGVASWPAPGPAQLGLPGRVSAWLASPAASPLIAVVAAVTTIGWVGGAIVMAAAAATAHPVLPAVAVDASGFVLAVADMAAGIGVAVRRARRPEAARPARAPRAMRRAARRARRASSAPSVAVRAVRRAARWHGRAFASLPRPLSWFFAAAIWSTIGAISWVAFELVSHGWSWADLGTTAAGQQFAAAVWMTHLIAWSGMTCRRLDRTRLAARMMTRPVSAGRR